MDEQLGIREEQKVQEENKFIVIPVKDLRYLDNPQHSSLKEIVEKLAEGRKLEGKKSNEYYVCNQDEPYAKEVLEVILKGEEAKRK